MELFLLNNPPHNNMTQFRGVGGGSQDATWAGMGETAVL